jgi:anti-sigma-K factor RskA
MNDEQFRTLMRQWRDIEPSGSFEVNIFRKIRLAATEPRQSWLIELFWRPAFAMAIAAVISMAVGSFTGILISNRQRTEMQFMSAGTLAGGYLQLTARGR